MSASNRQRRLFLQAIAIGGTLLSTGLIAVRQAVAAWNETAFTAKNTNDALKALFGDVQPTANSAITLKAPDIAENGAVVPISVTTELPNVESISIIVTENPSPLAASFDLTPDTLADVSLRIKIGKTATVIAVVKADGKLYSTQKEVKVTIGGCGG